MQVAAKCKGSLCLHQCPRICDIPILFKILAVKGFTLQVSSQSMVTADRCW